MTVVMFSEGLGRIEAGIKEQEVTDWKEQRPATTRQGKIRMPACYEKILKEKTSLCRQILVLNFFN